MDAPLLRLIPPPQNHEEGRQPNGQEKTPQWDGLGHKGIIPNYDAGAGQVVPKSLPRTPMVIPVTLPYSPKIKSCR